MIELGIQKRNGEIFLSWDEIGQSFNITGEQARNKVRRYLKKNNNLSSSSPISLLIDEKTIELQKERIKFQSEKNETNKWIREFARAELFIEKIQESIKTVNPPVFKELPIQQNKKGAILGFSDIHSGKQFKSVTNEYSIEILKDRMELLLSKTIYICKKENISQLNILNTSDSVEGLIRISQMMSLQLGLTDSVIWFARMMVEWLNKLSEYVEIIYHHVPSANHSEIRPFGTSAGQFPKEDMERIIIIYIHDMLINNKRITVPLYESNFAKFELCGYKIMARHKIKNIKSAIKDLSMLHREFIDYLFAAHYHHGEEISVHEGTKNNCEVILLPSVMGSDSYSDELLVGSKASAKLYTFTEEQGKTIAYDIILN